MQHQEFVSEQKVCLSSLFLVISSEKQVGMWDYSWFE